MTQASVPPPAPEPQTSPARPRRSRWRDPRLWVGVAVTAVTLWLALRGVSFQAVARDLARADLPLVVGVSVPAYVLMVWLRALRWRYLTDAVCPISNGPLFRATAVGFMANNVFPLRIGEVVRAWYLSRETGARTAAIFGTIILERAIDAIMVVAMALVVFGTRSASGPSALSVGVPLLLALMLPLGAVMLLRVAPETLIGLVTRVLGLVAPQRMTDSLAGLIRRISEGFGSLQGGSHLLWVAFYSLLIWLVIAPLPFLAGIEALGIDLGSPTRVVTGAFRVLTAVGIAVAAPSAPGFFGPYHLAAREALARFGVSQELALALGTLSHAIFWLTTTGLGLAVLRFRATPLDEIAQVGTDTGKDPAADRR